MLESGSWDVPQRPPRRGFPESQADLEGVSAPCERDSGLFRVNKAASWCLLTSPTGFCEPRVRQLRPAAFPPLASWAVWGVGTQLDYTK